jgi:hypothetical protein
MPSRENSPKSLSPATIARRDAHFKQYIADEPKRKRGAALNSMNGLLLITKKHLLDEIFKKKGKEGSIKKAEHEDVEGYFYIEFKNRYDDYKNGNKIYDHATKATFIPKTGETYAGKKFILDLTDDHQLDKKYFPQFNHYGGNRRKTSKKQPVRTRKTNRRR